MRTDGRTDMTRLINAFRNFADAPKMASPALNKEQLVETREILIMIGYLYFFISLTLIAMLFK